MGQDESEGYMSVLNEPTLVLNSKWRAIGIDTVRESIKKISKGSCRFMNPDTYEIFDAEQWAEIDVTVPIPEHPLIQSAKQQFVAPRVVLLVNYEDMPKNEVRLTRRNVLVRDKFMCQYCGIKVARPQPNAKVRKLHEYTWDHVTPRSLGGKTTWTNIVTACFKCNARKANRMPEKCGMTLISQPVKPKMSLALIKNIKKKPACWDKFLTKEMWDADAFSDVELEN